MISQKLIRLKPRPFKGGFDKLKICDIMAGVNERTAYRALIFEHISLGIPSGEKSGRRQSPSDVVIIFCTEGCR